MKRALVLVALTLIASLAPVACDDDPKPVKDLTSIYGALPVFPGATVDGVGAAPATLVQGDIKAFVNDRRLFVASSDATKEHVLDFYAQELPKSGWVKEDPPEPKTKEMKTYCPISYVTCLSFIKDDVRVIVSSTLQLQLNPLSTQGVSFHIHLESI